MVADKGCNRPGMSEGKKEEGRAAKENLAHEQGEDKVEEEVVSDDVEDDRRHYKKSNQSKTHLKSSQVCLFTRSPVQQASVDVLWC